MCAQLAVCHFGFVCCFFLWGGGYIFWLTVFGVSRPALHHDHPRPNPLHSVVYKKKEKLIIIISYQ